MMLGSYIITDNCIFQKPVKIIDTKQCEKGEKLLTENKGHKLYLLWL